MCDAAVRYRHFRTIRPACFFVFVVVRVCGGVYVVVAHSHVSLISEASVRLRNVFLKGFLSLTTELQNQHCSYEFIYSDESQVFITSADA